MNRSAYLEKMYAVLGHQYFSCVDLPQEEWLAFSEWKGTALKQIYQASNKGRIKDSRGNVVPGSIDTWGYHVVNLQYATAKGNDHHSFVHSIVLTLFKGCPPSTMKKPTVQHIDHNPLNNSVENLEWMESADNSRDAQAIKIKIIDNGNEYMFNSKEKASIQYCEKHDAYINDCMKLGIPVTNKFGHEIKVSYQLVSNNEWITYVPTRARSKYWRMICTITDSSGVHEFRSIAAATRYLGLKDGRLDYCYRNNIPIISNVTNEHVFVSIPSLDNIGKENK